MDNEGWGNEGWGNEGWTTGDGTTGDGLMRDGKTRGEITRSSPSCSPRRQHRQSHVAPAAPRRGCSGSRHPPARCGACPPAGSSDAWRRQVVTMDIAALPQEALEQLLLFSSRL